jgi:hypothetical protein
MSPMGAPLLMLLSLSTVATPVAAYLLWARVPGPRWARLVTRWAMVVVAQLSALLLVAAAINDYGQIFSSWGQVIAAFSPSAGSVRTALARSPHAGGLRHYGAPESFLAGSKLRPLPRSAFVVSGSAALPPPRVRWTGWSKPTQWRSRGAIADVTLTGASTGLSGPAEVYLPAAYFAGARDLPVVEVFTGYPGSQESLVTRMHYPDFAREQVKRKSAVPMVLVMARPAVTYPRDTECTNVPAGDQAFSYWATDAPAAVSATFGLRPTGYAAMGDSTGGYCAVKLAMLDPSRFRAGVALSGYFNAETDATTGELFGGSTHVQQLNDLRWRLRHLPPPAAHVLLGSSTGEVGYDGYRTQQRFAEEARPPMSLDLLTIRHGSGHTFATWSLEIPTAMTWLSWQLLPRRGFAAAFSDRSASGDFFRCEQACRSMTRSP